MRKITQAVWGVLAITLWVVPVHSQNKEVGGMEQRELIYCADQMTHEEREAYRAKMRAARTQEEKAALRQSHQQEMQLRVRQRGLDANQCEPLRLRERRGQGQ